MSQSKHWLKKAIILAMTFILTIGMTLGMLLPLNANASSATDNSLNEVKKKGVLVMGTSPDYPPYEFQKSHHGQSKDYGADIQLGKQIAKKLHVKLKIKNMSFNSLLTALNTHKVDMIIAALSYTPQRAKNVNFSKSYADAYINFVVNKQDAKKYHSYKNLANQSIGAQLGTTQYTMAKKQIKNVHLKGMDSTNDLVIGLKSGRFKAVPMEKPAADAYIKNTTGLAEVPSHFKGQTGQNATRCIAFHKGANSLTNAANKVIEQDNHNHTYTSKFVAAAGKKMGTAKNNKSQFSLWNYKDYFIKGLELTIVISVASVIMGLILGVIFALMRLSHNWFLHTIAVIYIEFIRGTPELVQIMFVYFGLGEIVKLPALTSGIIAIGVNSGAYVAEIIRSGINSVDKGQMEAALSLGLSKAKGMKNIVLPQAFKNIWPALGNEFVTLLKDSSLVSTIGVAELMYEMKIVQADTYEGVLPIFIIMIIYFIMTNIILAIMHYYEKKFNHKGTAKA